MPAPKPLPKANKIISQQNSFFIGIDKGSYARDSTALGMLARALEVIGEITASPQNYDRWILNRAENRFPRKGEKSKKKPIRAWEYRLAKMYNETSFGEIRALFPETTKEANSPGSTLEIDFKNLPASRREYHADHNLHPRLNVLEEWKKEYGHQYLFPLTPEIPEHREFLHRLENRINYDAINNRSAYDQHIRHVHRSQRSAVEFAHELFITHAKHHKLQVIQLILHYSPPARNDSEIPMNYETAKSHWNTFCRCLQMLECAYVAKLAHSRLRSYHFHVILFFAENANAENIQEQLKKSPLPISEKPSEHSLTPDAAIGDVIGRLWMELSPSGREFAKDKPISLVVEKMGSAYNFNAQKVPPVGTGLIGGKDSKQRRALAENILKPIFGLDLYVRLMPPKQITNSKNGDRTYWKGGEERLPILPPSKRGRPRKQTERDVVS